MQRKVLIPLLLVPIGSVSMAVPFGNQVEGEECTVNQHYEDGVCKNCAPCANYNRQPSKEPRACGKTIEDCGPCLPGFNADEWTQGRYSPMCSKVADSESLPVRASSDGAANSPDSVLALSGVAILGGIFGAVLLLVAGVTLGIFYFKRRHSQPQGRHDEEAAKMLQDGPPPYEALSGVGLVSAERVRDELIVYDQSNEAVTNAAPIEHFFDRDEYPRDEDRFLHPFGMGVDGDRISNSSEETAPDDWAPSDDHVPRISRPVTNDRAATDDPVTLNNRPVSVIETRPNSPRPRQRIRRTQSLDLHPPPSLGNYEGVHVRLSELRRSLDATPSSSLPGSVRDLGARPSNTRCTTPGLPTYADEGEEPEPPRSFSFNHLADAQAGSPSSLLVPVGNSSHDSGFEDEAQRRRTYNDAFEVLVFFRLDVKRRRND